MCKKKVNTVTKEASSKKYFDNLNKISTTIYNIATMFVMLALCTGISIFFKRNGSLESDIVMVYLMGIIVFSYLVSSYFYSFLAAVCGVLFYNFFFTEPYFTLQVYNPGYPVTFLIMFIVGSFIQFCTGTILNACRDLLQKC